jgi:hypothetical protein
MDTAVLPTKEELSMSIKTKLLAAAATLTVAGAVTTVGTIPARAATPQCGSKCIQVFSPRFGASSIESVLDGVAKAGQPTILGAASGSNPAGDFMPIVMGSGHVSDFFAAGMVSAEVNSHFGNLPALQLHYTPSGNATGLCSAVAATAYQNEALSLEPCSTPGTTVWIIDPAVAPGKNSGYFGIINGSTTDFSRPFSMTYNHEPPAPIVLDHLHMTEDGTAPITQLWSRAFGVVPTS